MHNQLQDQKFVIYDAQISTSTLEKILLVNDYKFRPFYNSSYFSLLLSTSLPFMNFKKYYSYSERSESRNPHLENFILTV